MRETRLDVYRVLREEDLLQPPGERDVRTRRTRDGSEAFVRVRNFTREHRSIGVRFSVGHKREGDEKERTRVSRVYEGKREESEGGEKTASVGKEEREGGTKTNE